MTHIFFCFKCSVYVNDNCRIIYRKMKICPFNITFLHTFLYRIAIKDMKSLFVQKSLTRKLTNIFFFSNLSQRQVKQLTLKEKQPNDFHEWTKFNFVHNLNVIIETSQKHVCLTRNYWFFVIKNALKLF